MAEYLFSTKHIGNWHSALL